MIASFNSDQIIVDSFAWIEYLKGSELGKKAQTFLDNPQMQLFTVDVCLAEIVFWLLFEELPLQPSLSKVQSLSMILNSTELDWIEAAKTKFEKRKTIPNYGIADALVLAKSQKLSMRILTGDQHFKSEPNVIFI